MEENWFKQWGSLAREAVGEPAEGVALAEPAAAAAGAAHGAGVGGDFCFFPKFLDGELAFGEGIGVSFIPKTFDRKVCDAIIMVSDDDAFATVRELARKEGVLGGSSSGANVFAAMQIAKQLGKGKRVVTVIPDAAERYLSKNIFDGGI